jgi:hypothetical protein
MQKPTIRKIVGFFYAATSKKFSQHHGTRLGQNGSDARRRVLFAAEAYYPYVGAESKTRQRSQLDHFHQAAKSCDAFKYFSSLVP